MVHVHIEKKSQQIADDYKKMHPGWSRGEILKKLIQKEGAKTFGCGFLTGAGGLFTAVLIPGDIACCVIIEMQLIQVVAAICGHDLQEPSVKGRGLLCFLSDKAKKAILKSIGGGIAAKCLQTNLRSIFTREVLKKITKAVGFRLVAQTSTKANVITIEGTMIPVIGGVFNGAINSFFTNRCFRRARKEFFYANEFIPPAILNNQSTLSKFNSVKRYVWEIQVRFWCDGRIWHSYLKRVEPKDQRKVIKLHAAYNFYRFSPNGEDPFRSILNVSNSLEHEGTMAFFPFVDWSRNLSHSRTTKNARKNYYWRKIWHKFPRL